MALRIRQPQAQGAGTTNYSLACDSGSVTITGTDATLTYTDVTFNNSLACDSGSVVINGTDATLTYTPVPVPHTTADFNFRTGSYLIDGVSVALASNVDHPEFVTAGTGLVINTVTGDFVDTSGDLEQVGSIAGATVTVEWISTRLTTVTEVVLEWENTDGDNNSLLTVFSQRLQIAVGDENRFLTNVAPVNPAVRRVSFVRTDDRIALSFNGGAVTTTETDYASAAPVSLNKLSIGGNPNSGPGAFIGIVRRLIIGPAVTDAELPGLSTVDPEVTINTGAWLSPAQVRKLRKEQREAEEELAENKRKLEARAKAVEQTIAEAYAKATGKEVKKKLVAVAEAQPIPTNPADMAELARKVAAVLQPVADNSTQRLVARLERRTNELAQLIEYERMKRLVDDEDAAVMLLLL